jgi:nucleoside-diphosphate-sugar epimerase
MKILITGANGYIGKSLYNALKDKYEVTLITRDKIDLTNSDKVNFFFLNTYFDIVLHCAIEGGHRLEKDNWNVMDDNLMIYYNLLQNKKSFGKFINFGSGAELYMIDTPYGLSKNVIRKSLLDKEGFYNIRMFGLFDENELNTRFIKANIKRYINNEPIEIHQDKIMDFFYMKDLIKLIEYYINNLNPPKEIDCKYTDYFSLKEISHIINNLDNHKVEIKIKQKGFGNKYAGTYTDLGINFIGLYKGIKETYLKLK